MADFKQTRWDLSDVLQKDSIEELINKVRKDADLFAQFREKLPSSKEEMVVALKKLEEINETNSCINAYTKMLFSEDTRSQKAKALDDIAEKLDADINNKTLFFNLWWKKLDDETAGALAPENEDYRYYLYQLRKEKPYTLDEKVEQAINIKNVTGRIAFVNLYTQITSAFTYAIGGVDKKLMLGELRTYISGSDAEKRVAAYESLMGKYAENKSVLGEIYRALVKDWKNEHMDLRKYPSPISVTNLANDVSDKSIETLLSVCRKNSDVFQDFFKIKAKLLNMDKISRYHLYAPFQQSADKKINYAEGIKMVLDSFSSFDEKFGEYARNIFEANHVDSESREGKKTGAYCMGVSPNVVPYVLLNYNGTIDNVVTIGHEFFHGIHDQLASKHSILTVHPSLILAESAGEFGAMIISDKFTENETDPHVKMNFILKELSRDYASIPRQAYFAIFEKDAHDAIGNKDATIDDIDSIYLSNLKEQFGNAVDIPEEFKHEWVSIPHIYNAPFYVSSYAFGRLLTLSLYDRYKNDGDSFKKDFSKILSYGGSFSPHKILSEAGINIESAAFWQGGYNVLRERIRQLGKM